MMRIKGCLWHEGSNGLGVGPMWLRRWLPYRKTFDTAARKHDDWYDTKGDGWARELDDLLFLCECLKVAKLLCSVFSLICTSFLSACSDGRSIDTINK